MQPVQKNVIHVELLPRKNHLKLFGGSNQVNYHLWYESCCSQLPGALQFLLCAAKLWLSNVKAGL